MVRVRFEWELFAQEVGKDGGVFMIADSDIYFTRVNAYSTVSFCTKWTIVETGRRARVLF